MNKIAFAAAVGMYIFWSSAALCAGDVTGRSFYQPRAITQQPDLLYASSVWHQENERIRDHYHPARVKKVVKQHPQAQPAAFWDSVLATYWPFGAKKQAAASSAVHYRTVEDRSACAACLEVDEPCLTFGIAGLYQTTTERTAFAPYFLPGGKNDLVIKGANAAGPCDLSATWLQIVGRNTQNTLGAGSEFEQLLLNEYSSTIRLKPSFALWGATPTLSYVTTVHRNPCYLTVGIPLLRMRTHMHLTEYGISNTVASFDEVERFQAVAGAGWPVTSEYALSARAALEHPNRWYGKIASHPLTKTGIGDLFIDLGIRPLEHTTFGVRVSLPTAEKASPAYLLAPVLGNNGRAAVSAYARVQYPLAARKFGTFSLQGHGEASVIASGHELRTYDLRAYGPWSRYLLLVDRQSNALSTVPGVNILTRPTHVAQRHEAVVGWGVHWQNKAWQLAAGHSINMRSAERLALYTQLPRGIFVAGHLAPAAPQNPNAVFITTTPLAINQHIAVGDVGGADPQVPVDADPYQLDNNALDVASAAMPSYLSNQLSLHASYQGSWRGHDCNLVLGTSYELMRGVHRSDLFSLFGMLSIKV